jgi:hypothetical protein
MRKARKLIKSARRLLIALVLLLVTLIVAVSLLGGRVAGAALENAGIKAFRTAVTIDKTRVSTIRGSLHLDGLTIDNPSGYKHKTFLELKQGDMRIRMADLLGKELTIRDLTFDGLNLILEPSGSGSNLRDIIESLRQAPPLGKRLYVDHLKITNITVTMALVPSAGQVGLVPVKMAPIEMTDLGRDEVLTASKLAYKVLAALAANLTKPNGVSLPAQTGNGVLDAVIDLGKIVLGTKDANVPANPADHR